MTAQAPAAHLEYKAPRYYKFEYIHEEPTGSRGQYGARGQVPVQVSAEWRIRRQEHSIPGEPNSLYVNMTGTAGAKAWRVATFLEERNEFPLHLEHNRFIKLNNAAKCFADA